MLPELPELPEIQSHSTRALRLTGSLIKRLPQMHDLNVVSLFGYDPRALEARRLAEAMRIAFEITRIQNARMRARSREEERYAQRWAEGKI